MGSNRLDSVTLKVLVEDKVFHSGRFASIEVPLNYFLNKSTVTFEGGIDFTRKLVLGYQVQTQFVSEDCGPRYVLSNLDTLSKSKIDSIRFVDRTPSRSGGRHIEIFRCPKPDTLGLSFRELTFSPTQATQNSRFIRTDLNSILVDDATPVYVSARATTVRLPVNLKDTTTTYKFDFKDRYGNGEIETLIITYDTTTEKRYEKCGVQTFITDLKVKPRKGASPPDHTFDSIRFTRDANDLPRNRLYDPIETNIEIFKCPETNILQIVLRRLVNTSLRNDTLNIKGITTPYNNVTYYENEPRVSLIRLPLDLNAGSTTFTIDFQDAAISDVTFTVNYTVSTRRFFGNRCGGLQRAITGLTSSTLGEAQGRVGNTNIQFPPVTNIEIFRN